VIGPALPVALCRCGTQLSFERAVFRGWVNRGTGWRCHCTGCIDGETFSDGSRALNVVAADGQSPWDALTELAAVHFDCDPEQLLEVAP